MKREKEKKQDSKTEEESELEKEIEKTESQENLEKISEEIIEGGEELNEFIQQPSTKFSAPVLEQIKILSKESLEQNISSTPKIQGEKDEKQIKYSGTSDEPNYSSTEKIKYQTNIEPPILQPTEISEDLPRQELLNPLERAEITQNNLRPKIIETTFIEEKTILPFEKDEKKYKEIRL